MSTTLNSSIRPIRIPRPGPSTLSAQNGQMNDNLPTGWSLNKRDEILNEEGLVMMDIQEEIPIEHADNLNQTSHHSARTIPSTESEDSILADSHHHQLPSHISQFLDKLELEEELELELEKKKLNEQAESPNQSEDENSTIEEQEFITPSDLGQEVDKALNHGKINDKSHSTKEEEAQELKAWGKTGLDGLKNIYKNTSKPIPLSTPQQPEQLPSTSPIPVPSTSIMAGSQMDKLTSQDGNLGSSTTHSKKSVKFAPETYLNPPKSSTSPLVPDRPLPSPGIMLSDIVERPIIQPTPPVVPTVSSKLKRQSTKIEVTGVNAYLNPRLASLLPRSLQNGSCLNPSTEDEQGDEESAGEDQPDLEDSDEDADDGSSTWSYDEGEVEAGSSWPPEDLDIQTALDLRQAALEYHTKRQGLGLGRGTGALGGDRVPGSDDESEWVPLDTRVQAPGVPRRSTGQSRFKTGRVLHPLDGTDPEVLGDEKVIDGKLFGAAPIIDGPAPTMGAAVHQLPGRPSDFTEADDELTAEELELLKSRLEVLGMDEERRIAAEKAGSELMAWMEKARTGEVELGDDDDHQAMTTTPVEPENHVDLTSTINPSSSQQQNPSVGNPSRNEGPPEIKTALKSSALKSRASTAMNPSPDASGSSISNGPLQSSHTVPKTTSQQQSNKIDQQTSMENNDQLIPETSSSSTIPPKKVSRFKASKQNL
ncbi:hypothetical protein KEM48_006933 [Puccinia striiformis f. sp. tritici PST-130]|nr:hypothetical protein Pst134EB_003612 [Puccinia striiformis f. sp. tritici]KAI9617994.1 hypothetical protein KEM48_006933 [Puccinia striiformis f. sp. tritici PST-130]